MDATQRIDPIACLRQQQVLEGELSSEQLPRLSESLSGPTPDISYKLTFHADAQGRCIIDCFINTFLKMQCHHCGQEMVLPVSIASQLCIITDAKLAKNLPDEYEPLVVESESGTVSLLDVIEDELILAIPMIPRHEGEECPR